jgi:transcriptional regulator with XRE-family HTH domain
MATTKKAVLPGEDSSDKRGEDSSRFRAPGKHGQVAPSDLQAMGQRLKQARGKRSQEEIERLSGCSSSAISRSEAGSHDPPLKLLSFYKSEGISADFLIYGQEVTQDSYESIRALALNLPTERRIRLAAELLNPLSES